MTVITASGTGQTVSATFRYRGRVGTPWSSNSSTIVEGSRFGLPVPDAVITFICAPDDGWSYHPKYVEQFTGIK